MEAILILALLAGVLFFFYSFGSNGPDRYAPPPKEERPTRTQVALKSAQPKPFDHSTAKPAPPPASVCGPARIIYEDTIVIKKTQVRMFGVDAPELEQPYVRKPSGHCLTYVRANPYDRKFWMQTHMVEQ